jgi:hypothetical protein
MGMTAVMQPYLFPYIGYFQLVAAVDHFVFYDDVQYINDGWINRNRLPHGWFTVPVAADRLSTPIKDRRVASGPYRHFRRKWLKGFEQRYRRAPYYLPVRELVEQTFVAGPSTIDWMAQRSIRYTSAYLGLDPVFTVSSALDYDRELPAQGKLLSLLGEYGVKRYINQAGGRHLYQSSVFADNGIELNFLHSTLDYAADGAGFGFSILHLLAHHSPQQCRQWLSHYTVQTPSLHEPPYDAAPQGNSIR